MSSTKRNRRRLLWRGALIVGLLVEIAFILVAVLSMIKARSYYLHVGQQVVFIVTIVWIYIAYLKQRSLDISVSVVDEKVKTHSLVQSLREGVLVVSPGNQILLMNSRAAEITGLSELESLGRDLAGEVDEPIQTILASGRAGETEGRFMSSGSAVRVSINLLPVGKKGDPHKLVHVQTSPSRDEPLSRPTGVPVNVDVSETLRLMSDVIQGYLKETEPSEERVLHSSLALRGLVTALAVQQKGTKSQIDENGLSGSLNKGSFPIARLLEEIVSDIASLADAAGLSIDMAPIDEEVQVSGDGELLTDAIRQVIYCAVIASAGSSEPIRIKTAEMGGNIGLSVFDPGMPVDSEAVSDLFADPCQGVKAPDGERVRVEGGGYHLARGIVEAHGGSLWADNPEGQGLRVTMMLPRA